MRGDLLKRRHLFSSHIWFFLGLPRVQKISGPGPGPESRVRVRVRVLKKHRVFGSSGPGPEKTSGLRVLDFFSSFFVSY